jgi:hypothetical protein
MQTNELIVTAAAVLEFAADLFEESWRETFTPQEIAGILRAMPEEIAHQLGVLRNEAHAVIQTTGQLPS